MEDYRQDDAYIYANKSDDSDLIGLVTALIVIVFLIGFIVLK